MINVDSIQTGYWSDWLYFRFEVRQAAEVAFNAIFNQLKIIRIFLMIWDTDNECAKHSQETAVWLTTGYVIFSLWCSERQHRLTFEWQIFSYW